MIMKTDIQGASAIVYQGTSYPVVDGYAEVPQEVYEHVASFSHWSPVTEQIDKKTQQALQKAITVEDQKQDDQKLDDTPQS